MPSVTYMNGPSARFWDFIASLEQQGQNHPFFSQPRYNNEGGGEGNSAHPFQPPFGPWGHGGFDQNGPSPHETQDEKGVEKEANNLNDNHQDDDQDTGKGPSGGVSSDNEGIHGGRGRHGRCGGGRRGRNAHGVPHGHHQGKAFGPYCGLPHHHGRRGGWGRGGPFPFDLISGFFNAANNENDTNNETGDFTPEADIFDTNSAFVIHISLPGAKKEDVGVNWDAEKSELSIAGVIYRPGNEEFLKTLATNERKVGPFERKIRLGTRANPAQIDADMITAKLEDGVLRVQVPKTEAGFVEIRKVDIE